MVQAQWDTMMWESRVTSYPALSMLFLIGGLVACGDVRATDSDAGVIDGGTGGSEAPPPDMGQPPPDMGGDPQGPPFPSNGSEGAFTPTANVTLSAGIHQYTTIDIPANVTVTVTGGILELRAQGAIRIAGTINLSGASGRPVAANSFGSGGGATGNPNQQGSNGGAGVCPVGGAGGSGAEGSQTSNDGTCGERKGSPGGRFGGGAGGVYRGAGGGGGGYAGGAGGGSLTFSTGGNGASMNGTGGTGSELPGVGGQPDGGDYGGGAGASISFGATGGGGGSIGRGAIDDLAVRATFQPGSGGGGGAGRTTPPAMPDPFPLVGGAGGGGGGGALRIASPVSIEVTTTGALRADGGRGGGTDIDDPLPGGCGGGGSGGVIYLSAPVIQVAGVVSSVGGEGGKPSAEGGKGGLGRIRLSVDPARCSLAGTFTPGLASNCGVSPAAGTPGKVFIGAFPN